jgi:hypothetical protein
MFLYYLYQKRFLQAEPSSNRQYCRFKLTGQSKCINSLLEAGFFEIFKNTLTVNEGLKNIRKSLSIPFQNEKLTE